MMKAAREAAHASAAKAGVPPPLVIAITVLTSFDQDALGVDWRAAPGRRTGGRAGVARPGGRARRRGGVAAGSGGACARPAATGFVLVTPASARRPPARPAGRRDDQARTMTRRGGGRAPAPATSWWDGRSSPRPTRARRPRRSPPTRGPDGPRHTIRVWIDCSKPPRAPNAIISGSAASGGSWRRCSCTRQQAAPGFACSTADAAPARTCACCSSRTAGPGDST